MFAKTIQTPLTSVLEERIRAHGPIPFAEFMDACLYHPQYGYYNQPQKQRFADYYTSPDVHPIFGRLLARQFQEMWEQLGRPDVFWLVEAGAGTGRLAAQILDFAARHIGVFYQALRYVAVERAATRRAEHEERLTCHIAAGHAASASDLPAEIPQGCIFSNELLDAFPVHRVQYRHGDLREIYVGLRDDVAGAARVDSRSAGSTMSLLEKTPRFDSSSESTASLFKECLGPLSTPALADYFTAQAVTLREDQQAEAALQACAWIEDAGRRLGRGFVLTIDYGHEANELYDERHMRGTLLAYHQHRASEDFFAAPGEQDLTAHVNFTALDLSGQRADLQRTGLVSQAHFLLAIGRQNDFADLYEEAQNETGRLRARLLLKNLIHPEALGDTFHVFVQHKGIPAPRLTGLEPISSST